MPVSARGAAHLRPALTLPYVLGWVVAALILCGVAFAVHRLDLRRASPAASREAPAALSLELDPAEATAIVRAPADGAPEHLERTPLAPGGPWTLTWGPDVLRWPVEDVRARSALRILATTPFRPMEGLTLADPTTRLAVRTRGAGERVLELGQRLPGGQAAARISTGSGEAVAAAPASLADLFVDTPLLAWRDARLMPGAEERPRRVAIDTGRNRLVLERGPRGRWAIAEPIRAPAEGPVVEALLKDLADLRADRFRDDASPSDPSYGLVEPLGTIVIEGERVLATADGVQTVPVRRELRVGEQADVSGRALFVAASIEDAELGTYGPVVAQVPGERFSTITPLPEAYVRRRALEVSEADVLGVVIARGDGGEDGGGGGVVTYRRTLDGWRLFRPGDAEPRTLTEADALGLGRLLGLLTRSPAARIERADLPADALAQTARVSVLTRDDPNGGNAVHAFFAAGDGQGLSQQPVLFTDGILRRYVGEEDATAVNWALQRLR